MFIISDIISAQSWRKYLQYLKYIDKSHVSKLMKVGFFDCPYKNYQEYKNV